MHLQTLQLTTTKIFLITYFIAKPTLSSILSDFILPDINWATLTGSYVALQSLINFVSSFFCQT